MKMAINTYAVKMYLFVLKILRIKLVKKEIKYTHDPCMQKKTLSYKLLNMAGVVLETDTYFQQRVLANYAQKKRIKLALLKSFMLILILELPKSTF